MKAMFSVAKAVATISLILGAILLMTCGGGGGGSDGGSGAGVPPPPGPGDTEKFFPDAVGDAWYYNAKSSSSVVPAQEERFFEQVTVTSTKMVGGFLTKVFEDASTLEGEDPIEDYYSKDADGVTNHGNNDPSDTLTASIVPYREAKFPVTVGLVTEISKSDVDFGEDLDGDGSNERVDFTLRISVDGFEPQTVPAGTFSRTAKRTSKIDGNVRVSSGGPNLPFTIIENVWLAPGAGVIKQVVTVTIAGETLQESYEARGYQVDGIAHGMNLPYAFVEGLVPANSDIYMPGPPQIAADGSGFLLATIRQTGLQVTTPVTKIIAAFGDADGKILREVDVTTPQPSLGGGRPYDVAYDGTNYLLVYSAGTLNATPNPLLGTRISPTGTVLDGAAGFEIDEGTADVAAVAYGASSYLVVFTRFDNTINTNFHTDK